MIKSNSILKVDSDNFTEMLDNAVQADVTYQKAYRQYQETLKFLESSQIHNIKNDVEADVNYLEALGREIAFKQGLHFGMKFMLNLLAGKEVVEFE